MTQQVLTVSEAADRTGESERTINRRIRQGTIDAEKKGGMWLIDPKSLDQYAEDDEPERTPAPA